MRICKECGEKMYGTNEICAVCGAKMDKGFDNEKSQTRKKNKGRKKLERKNFGLF